MLHGAEMILSYSHKKALFYCRPTFDERHLPKNAGFEFVLDAKAWVTASPYVAFVLRDHADDEVKKMLAPMTEAYDLSWATCTTDYEMALPAGCELLPYQKAGVEFALNAFTKRRSPCGSVLIADPMGL